MILSCADAIQVNPRVSPGSCVMSLSSTGKACRQVGPRQQAVFANPTQVPTRAPPLSTHQSTMRSGFGARRYGPEREDSRPHG